MVNLLLQSGDVNLGRLLVRESLVDEPRLARNYL